MVRVFVLGIDCAEPTQVEQWIDELPNLKQIYETFYTRVLSTVPPITIPAWLVAFSGLNPGYLGLYDLKFRRPGTYTDMELYSYNVVKDIEFVWNYANALKKRVILCFVPGTYPPPRLQGVVVSDFFTPSIESGFTWPPFVKKEILSITGGEYIIDVYDYKRMEPRKLFNLLVKKIEQDFKVMRYLMKNYRWDLFIGVLMSIDRAQHTLWKFFDKEHPRHVHDPELEQGLLKLYKKIDEEFGEVLKLLDIDRDVIVVMSDHGAKRMYYRVNVNEVLIQEGLLKLKERPARPMTLQEADKQGLVDWDRTIAWAWGAYVGQVWINLQGREPRGCVRPSEYEDVCKQVADVLSKVTDPDGKKLNNIVYFKWDIYEGPKTTYMPDITVYFDNLHYGANDMIGLGSVHSIEALKGADDSNHAEYAIFMINRKVEKLSTIQNVANILKKLLQEE